MKADFKIIMIYLYVYYNYVRKMKTEDIVSVTDVGSVFFSIISDISSDEELKIYNYRDKFFCFSSYSVSIFSI